MKNSRPGVLGWSAGLMLLSLAAACGGSGEVVPAAPPTPPTVTSITPVYGATSVPGNGSVSATFSKAMDPSSITSVTFTLTSGPLAVPVPGTVTYSDSKAVFRPTARLHRDRTYSATITTEARSASGDPLVAKRNWRFDTARSRPVCP